MPVPEDRLAGALLGQALGDALGFVVEAEPPGIAEAYVRDCLLVGRAGERAHPQHPFGQYSDDTQLARELLLSVRDAGGWSPVAFAARVAELFRDGRDVGAGEGTRGAARRLLAGSSWRESGTPAPYAGNGSAMRVAPLGLLFGGDVEAMLAAAREQSQVTHLDPRCAAGAVAVAGAVALAATPRALDQGAFLETLARWVAREDDSVATAVASVASWVDLSPPDAAHRLHAAGIDPSQADRWRGVSAFVTSSVAWSLYAFLRSPDDYWTTVCTAIAVGGDTDTVAAMAGAIAGARLGPAALPTELVGRITDHGTWGAVELAALAGDCARMEVRHGAPR
jgi:ADP-ribosylglycohydrolase